MVHPHTHMAAAPIYSQHTPNTAFHHMSTDYSCNSNTWLAAISWLFFVVAK
jgi:hypothetical protein